MRKLIRYCLLCGTLLFSIYLFPQTTNEKVKVFLDCNRSWLCDFDYVRTEMKMVEFVRDRFQSDVHVLVITQFSSSGGEQNQVNFLGQQRFNGLNDTLVYFNDPAATEDEKRKHLVRYLKLGLTRYIAKTSFGKELEITYNKDSSEAAKNEIKRDPWNYWVYQFGASGSFSGNQNYRSSSYYGYLNADRETEEWKINIYFSADRNNQHYKDASGDSKFEAKNYSAGLQVAKSLTQHWSYGLSAGYQNSLFSNIQAGYTIKPKLEYSLFPYSKFNSERIVVQYMLGPVYNNYYDTTVYFKTQEWKLQQAVNLITSFTKPWGSVNIGIFWQNYFDDLSKNNLSFNGAISWRITKGLNFGIYGNYSLIHDQIALRKGEATRDQILVRNRELLSSFDYGFGLGFSYRFGSVSNSIVNPRFKGLSYSISF
jgi:hypothetical protein